MALCFAIGALLGRPGAPEIVDHAMRSLWERHRGPTHGGYVWLVDDDGERPYAMRERLATLGWSCIETIDDDLGRSAAGGVTRAGFDRMVADVCLGKVGAVAAREVSRFARNSRDWQQLIEMCRVVDTVLVDQETVYAPRQSNDRLLLGLKGSLNEYELDLLRQRSLSARYEKARRGELIVAAPVGFVKAGDRLEKDPDRRVQEAITLVFDKVTTRLRIIFSVSPPKDWNLVAGAEDTLILAPPSPDFSPE